MSTLRNLATKYSTLDEEQIEWLELLMLDGPLLADLALGDVVLWVPAKDGNYLAVAHNRPAGSVTLFYRDVLGFTVVSDHAQGEFRWLHLTPPAQPDLTMTIQSVVARNME